MTCPVNYADLLAKYQPEAIDTEEENDAAIAIAEELDRRQNRTVQEDALLKLLAILIEKFEGEHYPIPEGTPHSMLKHLIEARDLKQEDLAFTFFLSLVSLLFNDRSTNPTKNLSLQNLHDL